MSIRSRAIGLAAALVVGVAAISISTGQAEAKPRQPKDAGSRCVGYHTEPGEDITFYLPGDRIIHATSGDELVCGYDGLWHAP